MSGPEDLIERVAGDVGDGNAIDWNLCSQSVGLHERRWLENLRVLSEVRRVARTGGQAAATPEATILVSPPPSSTSQTGALPAWGPLQPLELLGRGGFGDVYRAWDTSLHRQVALKLVRMDAANAAAASAALEEGRLLARAEHPHVVRIYGVDTHEGRTGMWMELLQGVSLSQLIAERGTLAPDEVARIGIALCGALEAVHAANVVHQDVKPQNVLVESGSGRVVLMDFGSGRWRGRDAASPVAGTPSFMAPEVLENATPSPQSDVYGLGALLYYLLTGEAPVAGNTLDELRRRTASGSVRSLSSARPDVPRPLAEAIEGALARDRAQRYASAAAFREALTTVQQPVTPAPIVEPAAGAADAGATGAATNRRRRVRPLVFGLASAAVIAAALLVLLLPRSGSGGLSANVRFLDGTTGRVLGLDDAITSNDRLEIVVEPSRDAYLYVLNVDAAGHSTVMFPMQGDGGTNRLRAGEVRVLPGTKSGQRLGWTFGGEPGIERFLIVASTEPLADFESALAKLPAVDLGGGLTARPLGEEQIAELTRGVTGVAQIQRETSPSAAGAQSLFDLARRLASDANASSRVWIHEMRLDRVR